MPKRDHEVLLQVAYMYMYIYIYSSTTYKCNSPGYASYRLVAVTHSYLYAYVYSIACIKYPSLATFMVELSSLL